MARARSAWLLAMIVVSVLRGVAVAQTPPAPVPAATPSGTETTLAAGSEGDQLQAIRRVAEATERLFNAGDSQALAALFAENGEMVDVDGNRVRGRSRIEQNFRQLFTAKPGVRMDVKIDSVRLLSPTVALEEGSAIVTDPRDQSVERTRYTVAHARQSDGRWLMENVHDFADQAAMARHALDELAWLIGEWVEEGQGSVAKTTFAWTDSHAYLVGEFSVHTGGREVLSGSQRIGWDPRDSKIRSWLFDTDGGFAEATWTRRGEGWIVKMEGVNRDGSSASATQVLTRLSNDRYSWQSHDRVVGDHVKSDASQRIVVRRPAGPEIRELPHK